MTAVSGIAEERYGSTVVAVFASGRQLAAAAADDAAAVLVNALSARGEANVMLATGNSQLELLSARCAPDRQLDPVWPTSTMPRW